ncbi:cytochrome P450 [Fusarium tricinctum]|uniref:Cytochrome P450 n=1 Tax=Fusarium tricinctum TaxID=61284 RepID=A0A8K0RVB4_9HYPO|nr:cytochrome P450 [Fusarium tricinctum]
MSVDWILAWQLLLGSFITYSALKYFKRIYFHPLSKIPGPVLAGASHLYECYYNLATNGYCNKFIDMHKQYKSPVVRIGINHVHVGDPQLYHTIHSSGDDFYKAPEFYLKLGVDGSTLTITDPQEHKKHRSTLNPLFSRKRANDLAPIMAKKFDKVGDWMATQGKEGNPIFIHRVFRALGADAACQLLLGDSFNMADAPKPDSLHPFMRSVDRFTMMTWPRMYYPAIGWVLDSLPDILVEGLRPGFDVYRKWLGEAVDAYDSGKELDRPPNLFDIMVRTRRQEGKKVDENQIFDDVSNFLMAGMEGTTNVLSFATYFLLTHDGVRKKLQAELFEAKTAIQEFNHQKIMALPYLTGVVKECLRLSNTVPGSLPRKVPEGGIDIGGYHVPAGTIISMIPAVVEYDEDIFPEPKEFIPERWMGSNALSLTKWSIAFSKGRRQCLAKNLAYMELYTTIAVFFSRFEMELFDTKASDMAVVDRLAPVLMKPPKIKIISDNWKGSIKG